MATYYATGYTASNALSDSGTGLDVTTVFTFATSGLATPHKIENADVIRLANAPFGAVVTDFYISMPDVDSATSPPWDLGLLTQDPNAFLSTATAGQSAAQVGTDDGLVTTGVPLEVTSTTGRDSGPGDVFAITATAAATGAGSGGTIKGWVRYTRRAYPGSTPF